MSKTMTIHIDRDTMGHPVFEFGSIYNAYIGCSKPAASQLSPRKNFSQNPLTFFL